MEAEVSRKCFGLKLEVVVAVVVEIFFVIPKSVVLKISIDVVDFFALGYNIFEFNVVSYLAGTHFGEYVVAIIVFKFGDVIATAQFFEDLIALLEFVERKIVHFAGGDVTDSGGFLFGEIGDVGARIIAGAVATGAGG